MANSVLFKSESKQLREILEERNLELDEESTEIIKTMLELITTYSQPVKNLDMENIALRDFMDEKAESFFIQFKEKRSKIPILFEKNPVIIYNWSSISLKKGGIVLYYPFELIKAVNYRNFVNILCRKTRKKQNLDFETLFDILHYLLASLKPRILKWDVALIRNLVKTCCFAEKYPKTVLKYRSNKRYKRLQNLRVLGFYYAVNFPAIGQIPYMHLSHHKIAVPKKLIPFIEFESHPATKKYRGYQIFRLFLFPSEKKEELCEELENTGLFSEVNEWYCKYNFDSIKQTKSGQWRWEIDYSSTPSEQFSGKYPYITNIEESNKLSSKFLTYLETIHKMNTANIEEIKITTGLSSHMIKRYQKIAIERKYILPDLFVSRIGLNTYLQLCITKGKQPKLVKLIESLPKVKVVKSKVFDRYLVFLPNSELHKMNEVARGDGILEKVTISLGVSSIERGVNLSAQYKSNMK